MSRNWGQAEWIRNYWRYRMKEPFPEPFSIRQTFYFELPQIYKFVPDRVKAKTRWAHNFYNKMSEYCSDLFLAGEVSYAEMNIYNDAGASSYIYQDFRNVDIPPPKYASPDYPVEIWVENNATLNSLRPLVEWPFRHRPGWVKINVISGKGFAKSQDIEKLIRQRGEDVQVILTLNDFDPSGWCMADYDLQNRLNKKGLEISVGWIGVMPEQIPEERRIASLVPYKMKDTRAKAFKEKFSAYPLVREGYGFEVQALTPIEIRNLVRKYLNAIIPELYDPNFNLEYEGE